MTQLKTKLQATKIWVTWVKTNDKQTMLLFSIRGLRRSYKQAVSYYLTSNCVGVVELKKFRKEKKTCLMFGD